MVNSFKPATLIEAIKIKQENPCSVLYSGGTDLMVHQDKTKNIIFLNYISELSYVKEDDNNYYFGSECTFSNLLNNDIVPNFLKEAISVIASPAIRNRGTIGGNIANASPAGDTLPVLYVYDAIIKISKYDKHEAKCGRITNAAVSRFENIDEFIKGVKKTTLKDDEIIEEVIIPKKEFTNTYYQKVGARNSESISKASFAGAVNYKDGIINDLRLKFGAVGTTVVSDKNLEKKYVGKKLDKSLISDILEDYNRIINPIDDQRSTAVYRKKVCRRLLEDFLKSL